MLCTTSHRRSRRRFRRPRSRYRRSSGDTHQQCLLVILLVLIDETGLLSMDTTPDSSNSSECDHAYDGGN